MKTKRTEVPRMERRDSKKEKKEKEKMGDEREEEKKIAQTRNCTDLYIQENENKEGKTLRGAICPKLPYNRIQAIYQELQKIINKWKTGQKQNKTRLL